MNTIIVNAFAGPSAGKTTSAWEIAAELKKRGHIVEYVPEYAKELVWDGNLELLNGEIKNEKLIYQEKKRRIDRLIGKVDFVITDSPTIQSVTFLDSTRNEILDIAKFTEIALNEFSKYKNFNYFVERGDTYESVGRIHTLEQSLIIDMKIKDFMKENKIKYEIYQHNTIEKLADKIEQYRKGRISERFKEAERRALEKSHQSDTQNKSKGELQK